MSRRWIGLLGLTLAACTCGGDPDPAPTVAVAEAIRGGFTLEREDHVTNVEGTTRVEREATATTAESARGSLRLDTGAFVLLDGATSAKVALAKLDLSRGRLFVDATDAGETTVETSHGSVSATGATFAIAATGEATTVYCGAGEVTYRSERGSGQLAQGESLVLGAGAPETQPAELWDDWTGGLADPSPVRHRGPTYVGALAGRRVDELGIARTPLPIRSHDVRAVIRGDLAETTVTQTFFNARSDALEAEYTVKIPEGAIVHGFAVDTGAGLVEGAVGVLATEQGYGLAWLDPMLATSRLSWDGPDRLRARIFPVTPGATVRVQLRYTEWLDRRGDMRTYKYPMHTGSEAPLIGELVLEVDAAGADATAYRAGMGAVVEGGRVVLRSSDFRPYADFYLDLVDEEPPPSDVARLYLANVADRNAPEGDERYVLVEIPTTGDWDDDDEAGEAPPLELVLLVDASGATETEDLELARGIIEAVLRQLAPGDRVTLRVGDVRARVPEGAPEELVAPDAAAREAILEGLAHAELGGATDLGTMLREAAALVAGKPRGAVLYLGDGIPTTGALDATSLKQTLAMIDAPPRFFAMAVGDGANRDLLTTIFGGEGVHAVHERDEAARAVMSVLVDAASPMLRGVSVELGEGIERVYPRPPIAIGDGAPLRLVGRLVGDVPEEISIRGTRDGAAFNRTLAVEQVSAVDAGDVQKRWAVGRVAELVDGDAGREALVELGTRFGIVTPWTALVIGGGVGTPYQPVRGFDRDPLEIAIPIGGGGGALTVEALGGSASWRRRVHREAPEPAALPEATWVPRVTDGEHADAAPPSRAPTGDGGLGRAAVQRALAIGLRGPQGCYERKLTVRPDLSGQVTVEVSVDGAGAVKDARVVSSSLGAADVDICIVTEVRGLRFPETLGGVTVVRHTYVFAMPSRAFGARRQCSDASRQSLEVRRQLWRERLAASAGVDGALAVYREASAWCELDSWRARRTLLDLMLNGVGGIAQQVALYRAFGADSAVAPYLRRAILRRVRTPEDVAIVRAGLGLDVPVDWSLFDRLWKSTPDPATRLRLVRRWLDVVPEDMDLRLRLLALLEETGAGAEARRLARELRADPLADARVRTAVGEMWLRADDPDEARRVFSEIVEHAPLDPWARERLGDVYRAHGWYDDAYREYQTLARLRPGEPRVLLALAHAAAGAGRLDEALRLEQRLSETADDSSSGEAGVADLARLWTRVRIARLELETESDDVRTALARRERETGALRSPPALFVALTWQHPDDRPELHVRHPGNETDDVWERAPYVGQREGIEAIDVRDREEGTYLFELRREDRDALRDVEADLLVVIAPGTPDEHILTRHVMLTRQARRVRIALAGNVLEDAPLPPERTERTARTERIERPTRGARPTP